MDIWTYSAETTKRSVGSQNSLSSRNNFRTWNCCFISINSLTSNL